MNFGELMSSMRAEQARPLPAKLPFQPRIPAARARERRGEIIQFGEVLRTFKARANSGRWDGRLPAA